MECFAVYYGRIFYAPLSTVIVCRFRFFLVFSIMLSSTYGQQDDGNGVELASGGVACLDARPLIVSIMGLILLFVEFG